jgi:hypothetical protein
MNEYKTVCADVEVSLDEWSEAELVEYLTDLGYEVTKTPENTDWLMRLADAKQYHPEKFDKLFSEYVWKELGRIV